MLNELIIKNFALIDTLNISFHPGLNILTGETGAGKTIILSALNLILGNKASADSIRTGEKKATVEGFFSLNNNKTLQTLLTEKGIESSENTLILKRQISTESKTNCYANDGLITLNLLSAIGDELIDLHGQHQHQLLLKPEKHLDFLDAFGGLFDLREEVNNLFQTLQDKQKYYFVFQKENEQKEQKKQLWEFQKNEIDDINPLPGEKEKLVHGQVILKNSGKLMEAGNFIYETIYNAEGSIKEKLGLVNIKLKEILQTDPDLSPHGESLNAIQCQLDDLAFSLKSYTEKIEFNPLQQEEIENRLAELEKLERKYGGNISKVLSYRKKIEEELQNIIDSDSRIKTQADEIIFLTKKLYEVSQTLSGQRKQAGQKMEKLISRELAHLGMEKNKFIVQINPVSPSPAQDPNQYNGNEKGIDQVEFLFSVNIGEPPRPLAKVASGGELSRIMLALKSLLAEKDKVATLIFDEIDTGLGGKMAEVIGRKLKSLSNSHQIICITHLPQIASFADFHYIVEKQITKGRNITTIKELIGEARINEIARMLTGEKITQTTIKHAREMLNNGKSL